MAAPPTAPPRVQIVGDFFFFWVQKQNCNLTACIAWLNNTPPLRPPLPPPLSLTPPRPPRARRARRTETTRWPRAFVAAAASSRRVVVEFLAARVEDDACSHHRTNHRRRRLPCSPRRHLLSLASGLSGGAKAAPLVLMLMSLMMMRLDGCRAGSTSSYDLQHGRRA
jgi:hypothetical protein